MSSEAGTILRQEYARNILLLAQQKGSRLRGTTQMEFPMGRRQSFDRIGSVTAVKRTVRHGDTNIIDTPHRRRWAVIDDFEVGDFIDEEDIAKMVDPTNRIVQAQAAAIGRAMDQCIIDAFDDPALSGQEGASTVAFPSGTTATFGNGSVAMTVALLRDAKQYLDQNENDPAERRYCVHNAAQLNQLLGETEVSSSDYNTVKALVQGEINTFLGFTFIRSELLPAGAAAGTTPRYGFAWRETAMGYAENRAESSSLDRRPDKSNAMQALAKGSFGAVRVEEEGVCRFWTDDAV